jgi:hypothetical protein
MNARSMEPPESLNAFKYVQVIESAGNNVVKLLILFRNWPVGLYARYSWPVRTLLSLEAPADLSTFPHHAALCQAVPKCRNKRGSKDNCHCPRNAMGFCTDATFKHNNEAIPCRALATLYGVSTARVQQLHSVATAKMRRFLVADPPIVEMCREFRAGGVIPSAGEIQAGLEKLMGI